MFKINQIFLITLIIYPIFIYGKLSDLRLCANKECSEPVALAKTLLSYNSAENGILSFPGNADVKIFSKSAGSNENLWGVVINNKRGYVPKNFLRETKILVGKLDFLVPTEYAETTPTTEESSKENLVIKEAPGDTENDFKGDAVTPPYEVFDGTTIYMPSSTPETTPIPKIEPNQAKATTPLPDSPKVINTNTETVKPEKTAEVNKNVDSRETEDEEGEEEEDEAEEGEDDETEDEDDEGIVEYDDIDPPQKSTEIPNKAPEEKSVDYNELNNLKESTKMEEKEKPVAAPKVEEVESNNVPKMEEPTSDYLKMETKAPESFTGNSNVPKEKLEVLESNLKQGNPTQGSVDPKLGQVDSNLGTVDQKSTPDPNLGQVDPSLGPEDPSLGGIDPKSGPEPSLETVDAKSESVKPSIEAVDPKQGQVDPKLGPSDPIDSKQGQVDPKLGPSDPIDSKQGQVDPKLRPSDSIDPNAGAVDSKSGMKDLNLQLAAADPNLGIVDPKLKDSNLGPVNVNQESVDKYIKLGERNFLSWNLGPVNSHLRPVDPKMGQIGHNLKRLDLKPELSHHTLLDNPSSPPSEPNIVKTINVTPKTDNAEKPLENLNIGTKVLPDSNLSPENLNQESIDHYLKFEAPNLLNLNLGPINPDLVDSKITQIDPTLKPLDPSLELPNPTLLENLNLPPSEPKKPPENPELSLKSDIEQNTLPKILPDSKNDNQKPQSEPKDSNLRTENLNQELVDQYLKLEASNLLNPNLELINPNLVLVDPKIGQIDPSSKPNLPPKEPNMLKIINVTPKIGDPEKRSEPLTEPDVEQNIVPKILPEHKNDDQNFQNKPKDSNSRADNLNQRSLDSYLKLGASNLLNLTLGPVNPHLGPINPKIGLVDPSSKSLDPNPELSNSNLLENHNSSLRESNVPNILPDSQSEPTLPKDDPISKNIPPIDKEILLEVIKVDKPQSDPNLQSLGDLQKEPTQNEEKSSEPPQMIQEESTPKVLVSEEKVADKVPSEVPIVPETVQTEAFVPTTESPQMFEIPVPIVDEITTPKPALENPEVEAPIVQPLTDDKVQESSPEPKTEEIPVTEESGILSGMFSWMSSSETEVKYEEIDEKKLLEDALLLADKKDGTNNMEVNNMATNNMEATNMAADNMADNNMDVNKMAANNMDTSEKVEYTSMADIFNKSDVDSNMAAANNQMFDKSSEIVKDMNKMETDLYKIAENDKILTPIVDSAKNSDSNYQKPMFASYHGLNDKLIEQNIKNKEFIEKHSHEKPFEKYMSNDGINKETDSNSCSSSENQEQCLQKPFENTENLKKSENEILSKTEENLQKAEEKPKNLEESFEMFGGPSFEAEKMAEDESSMFDLSESGVNILMYLILTAVTLLIFSLGHYYIEKRRIDNRLVSNINALEKKLLVVSKESQILQEELNVTKEKLNSVQDSSEGSNEIVLTLKEELEEARITRTELEDQIATLEKELENATEAGLELNKMLADFLASQSGNENIMENVEHLQKQLFEQQSTINTINGNLNLKNLENEKLQLEIAKANEKIDQLQSELDKMVVNLLSVQEAKSKNEADFEQQSTQLKEEFESKIQQLTAQLDEIKQDNETLRKKSDELKRALELKNNEYQVLKESMKEVSTNKESLAALLDVSKVKAEVQQLREEKHEILEKLGAENDAKLVAEKQIQVIMQELKILKDKLDEADKEKVEAQTRLDVLSTYFKEKEAQLQKEIAEHESMWMQKQGEATSTVERIKWIQEELQNYKSQNEILKKEILDQEVSLKSQISMLEKKAHDNWVLTRQAERKLEESKQEASQLRNRLTIVEKNLSNASLDESKLQSRVLQPIESNGDIAASPLHMGSIDNPGSPPLLYPHRDHMTTSPPLPGLPFMPPPPPPGVPFMPPPPGVPPFMPPPLFPGDHRPPPLGRMSSPPMHGRYSPDSRAYSPYDRDDSPPPSPGYGDSDYRRGRSPPRNYSPYRDYRDRPPPQRSMKNRNHKVSSSGSGNSNESLDNSGRHSSRV